MFRYAHELVLQIYRKTADMPADERFALQGQLRRAAVSIPANLVEGTARRSIREYARFVDIALGSAAEVRYLLVLAVDLGLLSATATEDCRRLSDRVVRSLNKLQAGIQKMAGGD